MSCRLTQASLPRLADRQGARRRCHCGSLGQGVRQLRHQQYPPLAQVGWPGHVQCLRGRSQLCITASALSCPHHAVLQPLVTWSRCAGSCAQASCPQGAAAEPPGVQVYPTQREHPGAMRPVARVIKPKGEPEPCLLRTLCRCRQAVNYSQSASCCSPAQPFLPNLPPSHCAARCQPASASRSPDTAFSIPEMHRCKPGETACFLTRWLCCSDTADQGSADEDHLGSGHPPRLDHGTSFPLAPQPQQPVG